METLNKKIKNNPESKVSNAFINQYWENSWTYIKTVIDIVREPVLIIDKDFMVIAANGPFYETFRVQPKDTEGKNIYELGNGQWDIPLLKKLIEHILPKHTFFKGFEVTHRFPNIGRKIMILNARQIHIENETKNREIILLAIEDVTEMMDIAEMLARHTRQFELKTQEKEEKIKELIKELGKEIKEVKKSY
jgi:PAS domain-containing protein